MAQYVVKLRGYTAGYCESSIVVLDRPLNLYGDVEASSGALRWRGAEMISIAGRIVVAPALVGSTVAPYIAYALKKRGLQPCAIVTGHVDTVAVAAAVLGDIVLAAANWRELVKVLAHCTSGAKGVLRSRPPHAHLLINC
jgi:predicted aconitase with swiveling domain